MNTQSVQHLRILIAPLNWGLGHATRCIPIIEMLLEKKAEVILAGDGRSLEFLKHAYPHLPFISLPPYHITYSRSNSQVWAMMRQFPKLLKAVREEHQVLKEIVNEHQIDFIISDNRYGLWHAEIPSIFICHQLAIQIPRFLRLFRPWLYRFHLKQIAHFDQCWIPDVAGQPNLSYDLSHAYPLPENFQFIGPLSRFQNIKNLRPNFSDSTLNESTPDIAIILSGPEPQRTILEEILTTQAQQLQRTCWVIQGKTERKHISRQGNVWEISFLDSQDMHLLLTKAQIVISRPGYSSLMDYAALGLQKVILIPTPGQTEQEYLAAKLSELHIAYSVQQANIHLSQALNGVEFYRGFSSSLFSTRLEEVLINDII